MLVLELISCMHHSGKLKRRECMCAKPIQSCPTLQDPVDCRLPGFSIHGILQERILEWVAMPSSRGSSRPRDRTQVSCISYTGRRVLYHDATWEALFTVKPNSLNKENPGCDFFFQVRSLSWFMVTAHQAGCNSGFLVRKIP